MHLRPKKNFSACLDNGYNPRKSSMIGLFLTSKSKKEKRKSKSEGVAEVLSTSTSSVYHTG